MAKRLFVGTMLEPEQCRSLAELRKEIEPILSQWWNCHLRFVRPEKLHTTCLFLGDCDQREEAEIISRLKQTAPELKSCKLSYDRMSLFGNKSRPNAMVLLPECVPEEMLLIGKTVRALLSEFCRNKEILDFRPHLTILRFPRDNRQHYEFREHFSLSNYLPLVQKIGNLSLIESHQGSSGIDYKIIADFKLKD